MSTGMQLPQEAGPTAISVWGGWEPRWIDMAPMPVSTGEQIQVVSNLGSGSLGVFTQPGQGGAPIQFVSRGGMGSIAGSTVTSSSMGTLPQGLDVQYGGGPGQVASGVGTSTTNTGASIAALPGGADLGTGGAQGPIQIVDGAGATVTDSTGNAGPGGAPIMVVSQGGAGTTSGATVTSPSAGALPVDPNLGYGGGPGLAVGGAGKGTLYTASSIGMLPGGADLGIGGAQGPGQLVYGAGPTVTGSTGNAGPGADQAVAGGVPIQFVSRGSADATYGATVTSPSMGASPIALKVMGGQGLPISVADRGAMGTQQSIGTLPGPGQISTGGAESPVLGGGIAGSTAGAIVASSSAGNLPKAVMLIPGGAPMQMVSGTQSQASASSNSLG